MTNYIVKNAEKKWLTIPQLKDKANLFAKKINCDEYTIIDIPSIHPTIYVKSTSNNIILTFIVFSEGFKLERLTVSEKIVPITKIFVSDNDFNCDYFDFILKNYFDMIRFRDEINKFKKDNIFGYMI